MPIADENIVSIGGFSRYPPIDIAWMASSAALEDITGETPRTYFSYVHSVFFFLSIGQLVIGFEQIMVFQTIVPWFAEFKAGHHLAGIPPAMLKLCEFLLDGGTFGDIGPSQAFAREYGL